MISSARRFALCTNASRRVRVERRSVPKRILRSTRLGVTKGLSANTRVNPCSRQKPNSVDASRNRVSTAAAESRAGRTACERGALRAGRSRRAHLFPQRFGRVTAVRCGWAPDGGGGHGRQRGCSRTCREPGRRAVVQPVRRARLGHGYALEGGVATQAHQSAQSPAGIAPQVTPRIGHADRAVWRLQPIPQRRLTPRSVATDDAGSVGVKRASGDTGVNRSNARGAPERCHRGGEWSAETEFDQLLSRANPDSGPTQVRGSLLLLLRDHQATVR